MLQVAANALFTYALLAYAYDAGLERIRHAGD